MPDVIPDERIISDISRRVAFSTDASFYTKIPRLVVQVANTEEMQQLLQLVSHHGIAVTFRAAGTSLSGQAISDSVLIMLTRDWQQTRVLEDGRRITLQPGVIGAAANQALRPFQRKIGPDPASINTCKIGGIAANNASGMCCGVKNNSYHTLDEIQFVLSDGTCVDTGNAASVGRFRTSHATLLKGLSELAMVVRNNPALSSRIEHQYRLKNTLGYGINALLDFDDPVDILSHLLIGSEGTLAFIASITYRTVAIPAASATGLYLFGDIRQACEQIPALRQHNVSAVELMDTRALRSVANLLAPFCDAPVKDGEVALLIEVGAGDEATLNARLAHINRELEGSAAKPMCPFTPEPQRCAELWKIRKGLFPAVGAVRQTGTTVIIEDVAFPLEYLADGLNGLERLFRQHGYDEAIIFGHALDGNVHFVFTQGFETAGDIERYQHFMQDVAQLVTEQFQGTLKAEHGTGRNMAPFLALQWGEDGAGIMRRIKNLLDPAGVLNPGVIINDDPKAHLKDLKSLPSVDPIVDKCIECGFCEPQCPSLHYTLSPRQRIALQRRRATLAVEERVQIDRDFQFLGVDSCAATGLCATTCPVGINTGNWITELRTRAASHAWVANYTRSHLSSLLAAGRAGLSTARQLARWLGPDRLSDFSRQANRLTGGLIPVWYDALPDGADTHYQTSAGFSQKVVYFITCPNRVFGSSGGEEALPDVVVRLLNKAGFEVLVPKRSEGQCCGQPWQSKGYPDHSRQAKEGLTELLQRFSENGKWPVIVDASPCARQLQDNEKLKLFEITEFLLTQAVPRLKITPSDEAIMLHITCSSTHMDNGLALRTLAHLCSENVTEAENITCCGFAGDKGFTHPELNAAALASLPAAIPQGCQRGVSNSRTCELGLSHHSGIPYAHILYLLDEVSRPLSPSESEQHE
ncbi:FAD-binding oxidoreductase [Alteromonas aestuariivivens]|uniref:D-lactate dehydrogenase (cytochrome) n=1 Tax=Alteromonas aestuariivivens TaxID=1938339 RepID=A0A3D8MBR3_9ALTE|nr:FAD-binding oxidoreductase [Alteromonas aestuariivivens]